MHDQNAELAKRTHPWAIPVPEPALWKPLLSSIIHPLRSTHGIEVQVIVPETINSTYSLDPDAPCETSLIYSCEKDL